MVKEKRGVKLLAIKILYAQMSSHLFTIEEQVRRRKGFDDVTKLLQMLLLENGMSYGEAFHQRTLL